MEARQTKHKYTYADYVKWVDEPRYELIDGEAYMMSPGPTPEHQDIGGKIYRMLGNYLDGKPCRPYQAPMDVLFIEKNENEDNAKTVLQPDVLVVCDHGKIRKNRCIVGAPDLIVEVLSPSTTVRDFNVKRDIYQRYGVREYWIVSIPDGVIYQFKLVGGIYEDTTVTGGRIESSAIEGFGFEISELFAVLDF